MEPVETDAQTRLRRRLTFAEKLRLVNLAQTSGISAAARALGVNRTTAASWVGRYDAGGTENLRSRPRGTAPPRVVTPVVRQRLLALKAENPQRSAAKVARLYAQESGQQVHRATVWAVLKKGA